MLSLKQEDYIYIYIYNDDDDDNDYDIEKNEEIWIFEVGKSVFYMYYSHFVFLFVLWIYSKSGFLYNEVLLMCLFNLNIFSLLYMF